MNLNLSIPQNIENVQPKISVIGVGGAGCNAVNTMINSKVNNINFLGRISNDELLKKYSEYKIYLSLSEYEGNSKTILEAMGSGCVSVVSDIPNNKEIIKNNLNGIIFNKEKDNLLNIISQLFQNETTLQEISKNGIQYINENNSLKLIADKEFTNYSKLN